MPRLPKDVQRYQLPLDLERERLISAQAQQYREAALELASQTEVTGRFVRTVSEEVVIRYPADAAQYLQSHIFVPFAQFEQEEFWVLVLNTKNRVTHETMVYRGTANTVLVRVAEVFRDAIRYNGVSIIMAHCHPSGDPTPSSEDVQVTELGVKAGRLLDIILLDHIVVGNGTWISMKERGLGFKD